MKSFKFCYGLFLSLLKRMPFRILEVIGNIFPGDSYGCMIRGFIYKPFLKKCGKNFQVGINAKLEHLHNLEFGDDVYIGHGSWVNGIGGGIVFEDQVMLGPYVKMVSGNHCFDPQGSARFAKGHSGQIVIGFGTWVATNAVVTTGCEIGASSLIAAGAVVCDSFLGSNVIGGIPARIIKKNEY